MPLGSVEERERVNLQRCIRQTKCLWMWCRFGPPLEHRGADTIVSPPKRERRERGRERGRESGRESGRREGGREGGSELVREGGSELVSEGGREGERECVSERKRDQGD